ncbi:septal ring lytic transglycosylase RlpA family protein [Leptolyngbya sp. FACHB-16]|uniref:septal ring lytic transglycosylase RlpA family protein n=1 Tax=unclassified Leptolyngbya TaxID=2650499 RepID=UPI001681CF22|nr:septal ring lytic transglycosylase RlpA family protein [Leptolyngbya sp. FACHB-16]MBD2155953.1 septal ring lytic transglycosylase RlpA family protein [Leptolyngbya sp. FACHB-16]
MNQYLWSSFAAAVLLTSSLGVASAEALQPGGGAEEQTDPLSAVETIANARTNVGHPSQQVARVETGASATLLDISVVDGLTEASNEKFVNADSVVDQSSVRVATAAISQDRILVPSEPPLAPPPSPIELLASEDASRTSDPSEFTVAAVQDGVASWYGPGFNGNRSASGEVFNQNALTAAHRSLPFGTRVRVTNMRNGRSVIVRINDRGPFSGRRLIDLSRAAASEIGMVSTGTAQVRLEVLQ